MIVRSFANGFELQDWSEELNMIPNQWGTIGQLGIFKEEPVAEHSVVFEEITQTGGLIVDRVRGDRGNVNKDRTRKLHSFAVPHFPLDDFISPSDLQGKRAYGKAGEAEQLAEVRMRKMVDIAMKHAWTLEYARAQVITAGTVYSPNGTVSQNWFTEFGVSQTSVDMLFGTSTTEILDKINTGIVAIQDNAGNGGVMNEVVMLCGRTFFSRLIAHPTVKTAYQYYSSSQEPLRNRLGGDTVRNRTFTYGGCRFIEMGDSYAGNFLIPQAEGYMIPVGTDAFRTYFSPADRFGLTNTLGEKSYLFEFNDPRGTQITIESEQNMVNAVMRPAVIIKYTTSN